MVAYTYTQSQVVAFGGRVPATRYARCYGKLSGHLRAMRVTAKGFCGLSSRMWSCAKGLSFQPPSLHHEAPSQPFSCPLQPHLRQTMPQWNGTITLHLHFCTMPSPSSLQAVPWIHEAKKSCRASVAQESSTATQSWERAPSATGWDRKYASSRNCTTAIWTAGREKIDWNSQRLKVKQVKREKE